MSKIIYIKNWTVMFVCRSMSIYGVFTLFILERKVVLNKTKQIPLFFVMHNLSVLYIAVPNNKECSLNLCNSPGFFMGFDNNW